MESPATRSSEAAQLQPPAQPFVITAVSAKNNARPILLLRLAITHSLSPGEYVVKSPGEYFVWLRIGSHAATLRLKRFFCDEFRRTRGSFS